MKIELGATSLGVKVEMSATELHDKAGEQEIPGQSKSYHADLAAAVDIEK